MDALLERLDFIAELPYEQMVVDAALAHEDEITDLNRQQLDKGLDSEGNSLGRYRSFGYKGRWEPVDLLGEGPFRASLYIEPFGQGFQTGATDRKTDALQDKYGDAIIGTPTTELPTVGEILLPDVIEDIERRL